MIISGRNILWAIWLLLLILLSLPTSWRDLAATVHVAEIPLDAAFMELADELLRLPYQLESAQQKYEFYKQYSGIKDEAVLAKTKELKCLLYFPGTNLLNPLDVFQNFLPGFQQVCPINMTSGDCCQARSGFYSAYDAPYRAELEADITACVATCPNADECLYISGYSQGGSVAQIAAIRFQYANPTVISFANGRTLNEECRQLNSTRWMRFVNTRARFFYQGLIYDPWPFFSQIDLKAYNHGVTYIFSEDATALATVTVNAYERVGPLDWTQIAHAIDFDMRSFHLGAGYLNRIAKIIENGVFPVPSNGFSSGYYCTRHEECQSKSCKAVKLGLLYWTRKCE